MERNCKKLAPSRKTAGTARNFLLSFRRAMVSYPGIKTQRRSVQCIGMVKGRIRDPGRMIVDIDLRRARATELKRGASACAPDQPVSTWRRCDTPLSRHFPFDLPPGFFFTNTGASASSPLTRIDRHSRILLVGSLGFLPVAHHITRPPSFTILFLLDDAETVRTKVPCCLNPPADELSPLRCLGEMSGTLRPSAGVTRHSGPRSRSRSRPRSRLMQGHRISGTLRPSASVTRHSGPRPHLTQAH